MRYAGHETVIDGIRYTEYVDEQGCLVRKDEPVRPPVDAVDVYCPFCERVVMGERGSRIMEKHYRHRADLAYSCDINLILCEGSWRHGRNPERVSDDGL